VYLLGTFSTFLFWILLGSTLYWLVFYRVSVEGERGRVRV
jgi:hypothetical protein